MLLSQKIFVKKIEFTGKGIKEYLYQPHKHFIEKNELIKDIKSVISESTYKGVTEHKDRKSHIFEIEIVGEKSWLIVNEEQKGRINFYSVSDSERVLIGVKK